MLTKREADISHVRFLLFTRQNTSGLCPGDEWRGNKLFRKNTLTTRGSLFPVKLQYSFQPGKIPEIRTGKLPNFARGSRAAG